MLTLQFRIQPFDRFDVKKIKGEPL